MKDGMLDKVRELASQVADRESCYLYDLEFSGGVGGGRILRVYIDKDTPNGVSIEDCSNVSKGLNLMLDVDDVIPGGRYHLEVSSPGLERILRSPWHFEKVLGKVIVLKTFAPALEFNPELSQLGKAKQLKGLLKNQNADGVRLDVVLGRGLSEVFVPYNQIAKANVVFEFTQPTKGPSPHSKKM